MSDPQAERGPHASGMGPAPAASSHLAEVAALFLKLGVVGFGGPAAHTAMMEEEVVRRRGWIDRERFLDLLGATNLIPGPNSTELAIHLGRVRAGWGGLLVAGTCFILPAMLIVLGLAVAYRSWGQLPQAGWLLYGVKPVIIAIVVQALLGLGRKAFSTPLTAAAAAAVIVAAARGANEVLLLFATAILVGLLRGTAGRARAAAGPAVAAGASWAATTAAAATGGAVGLGGVAAAPPGLAGLGLIFLKVGAILFGSGYVLLAFLRPELVERTGWLTDRQLLDAIAVGQLTPGPVLTTATFIGYVVAGVPGALVATVGIFLPSFVLVALSGPLVPRLRASRWTAGFLDGANTASVALMVVVTWQLGRSAIVDAPTTLVAVLSAILLVLTRLNSAWLVLGGAAAGAVVGLGAT